MRMRNLASLVAVSLVAAIAATPASAVTNFTTNFDSYTVDSGAWGATGAAGWDVVPNIEDWNATGGAGIEVQNNVAGAPFSGPNHVELDSHNNSTMSRVIEAGKYTLSFYYSPRPGVGADSNPISVLLNGNSIYSVTANGGGSTSWLEQIVHFDAKNGDILSFAATGTNDSLGGYIDSVSLSGVAGVPEPANWALMIVGFGMAGAALRSRRSVRVATA